MQAREQMKDVLINLQMSLIIHLRTVFMDGMDLDFAALQGASDDCRVNAGVCLGQLSQRLSDATRTQSIYSTHPQHMSTYSSGSGLLPPLSPSLGYSSSRSTHSSAAFHSPRTPDAMSEPFGHLSFSSPFRPPLVDRKMSTSSGESQEHPLRQSTVIPLPPPRPLTDYQVNPPPVGVHRIEESDTMSVRRRSSQALAPDDNILMFVQRTSPTPSILPPQPNGQDLDRASVVSSEKPGHTRPFPDVSRASSGHQSQNSRDRFSADDYGEEVEPPADRQLSNGTIFDMYQPNSPASKPPSSYGSRPRSANPVTLDHVRYLQENSRPPRRERPKTESGNILKKASQTREIRRRPVQVQTDLAPMPPPFQARKSFSGPIPPEYLPRTPPPTGPLPKLPIPPPSVAAQHLTPPSINVSERALSIHTTASSAPSVTLPMNSGPLLLPTDKNLLGFCKGAFRLQAGMERKAFSLANRPIGFASMTSYWRCDKCNFEGPVHTTVHIPEGKKKPKPERVFDPKVRTSESGGIRYRWAFLARCHVSLKGVVPHDLPDGQDGIFGSFGCIFCCAEGKQRGWLDTLTRIDTGLDSISKSSASVKSGHTANTSVKLDGTGGGFATPIFGNVSSFMQHLDSVHRGHDGWPNMEMMGRFRIVVGRVAYDEEEGWELNFVPV